MDHKHDMQGIAVDGGGTRSRFALFGATARIVVQSGPANAYSDFDGTVRCLSAGLDSLSREAGIPRAVLETLPAFFGLAGVVDSAIADRLQASLGLPHARYADDRLPALRGALGPGAGVIAHCGTGSFFGAQLDGATRLAGGWGVLLGDEASAQWIGRKALALTLRRLDGFAAEGALVGALVARFGSAAEILRFAATATAHAFGDIAPHVTRHARQGDPAAIELLRSGAAYLSEGVDRMGWREGLPLCLTGGIGPAYLPYLPTAKQVAFREPLGTPLDGAIALARELAT
jgi:glucosamine kinase